MKARTLVLILIITGMMCVTPAWAGVGTGEFLYQGQLKKDGLPVNDTCDFVFSLWKDPFSILAGDQVGPDLKFNGQAPNPPSIDVVNGLFSALLDFGPTAFTDDPRWIEVAVVCPAGGGNFTTLAPRDFVAGAPYSIHTRGIFVDEDGDVGIGTDSPFASLTVSNSDPSAVALSSSYDGPSGNAGTFGCSNQVNDETALSVIHAGTGKGFLSYQYGRGTAGRFEIDNANSNAMALHVTTNGTGPAAVLQGDVGIGTDRPEALLHVEGNGDFRGEHIAFFRSRSGSRSDGIAIQLDNLHTNRQNNFITFYNGDKNVTGRIEGFDRESGDWVVPPPIPGVGLTVDLGITYNDDWITPGALPIANFTPGTLPTANYTRGTLPTANFTPGTLPLLTFSGGSLPTANFTPGTLPSLSFNDGSLPSFSGQFCNVAGFSVLCGFSWSAGSTPTANLNGGSLPSLTFNPGSLPTATFNRGILPSLTFNGGSLPDFSFSGGALPSLSFTPGTLPVIEKPPWILGQPTFGVDLPTQEELEALFCWSLETGHSDFLTLDPVGQAVASLKQQVAAKCNDEGVVYGSKGADYAEWLPKLNPEDEFQIGQIVGVHGGKVSLKTEGAEQIMAISRAPVVVGNVPPESDKDKFVTVGFMGQLPVVVRGEVRPGDFILASDLGDGTGVAVRPENLKLSHLGRILGRAWSDSDNKVFGLVDVAIGLNTNETAIILLEHQDRMDDLSRTNDTLAQENADLKKQLGALDLRLAALAESVRGLQADGDEQNVPARTVALVGTDR